MNIKTIQILLLMLSSILLSSTKGLANDELTDEQIEVSLRMIGHQVLLDMAGDSTSLVLPIINEANRYSIRFNTELRLIPGVLVKTVDRVIEETNLADHYVLEVKDCLTGNVAYSFEVSTDIKPDIIPCGVREYPMGCYTLVLTLIDITPKVEIAETEIVVESIPADVPDNSSSNLWIYISIGILFLIAIFLFLKFRNQNSSSASTSEEEINQESEPQGFVINHSVHMISLGAYQFNRITGELEINDQKTQLTGKESDLLQLLHSSLNVTVERDEILSEVWGDEGDYVGRTLDVFISKLRKKLEDDDRVKITNVRGVGYKLILG